MISRATALLVAVGVATAAPGGVATAAPDGDIADIQPRLLRATAPTVSGALVPAVAAKAAAGPGGDIAVIQQRLLNATWPTVSGAPAVAAQAAQFAALLNSSCYFTDIDYFDGNPASWPAQAHVARAVTLAAAFSTPWSPAAGNTTLRDAAVCATQAWFHCPLCKNTNWWYAELWEPEAFGQIFLMMPASAWTPALLAELNNAMLQAAWWVLPGGLSEGANLYNMLQAQLLRGCGSSPPNVTAVTQALARMWQDAHVVNVSTMGVQTDASYHFHGVQLLSGAYGAVAAAAIMQFVQLANGTQYAAPQDVLNTIAAWFVDGNAWMTVFNEFDQSVIGRSISRPGNQAGVAPSSSVLRWLAPATNRTGELLQYADSVDGTGVGWLNGNKHFWTSDYMVHRRPGYVLTVRMHSDRTVATECDNGENLKGEHLGDGVVMIYGTDPGAGAGREYYQIGPLLDWQALGGITVEHSTPLLTCGSQTGDVFPILSTAFVGGISDGRYGTAAMDTATHNLTALRSYTFLDWGLLGVASEIVDTTTADVWTTLAARLLVGNVTAAFSNGSTVTLPDGDYALPLAAVRWLHADGVVYVPALAADSSPAQTEVLLSAGSRTGTWQAIGAYTGSTTARVIQVSLRHGDVSASAGSYAYAVAPNTSLADAPGLVATIAASVGAQATKDVHAVVDAASATTSIVFWQPAAASVAVGGQPMTVTAAAPALVLLSLSGAADADGAAAGSVLTVTASNPVQAGLTLALQVDWALTGPACKAAAGGNSTVTITLPADPDYLGQSVSVQCTVAGA